MPNSKHQCAQADFALNLLREILRENSKNNGDLASVIISPSSLAIALAMAYAGARGETAAEINKLLGNGANQEEIHKFYGKTMSELFNKEPKSKYDMLRLNLANKIYVKTNYTILDEFDRTLRQSYGANFEQINFEDNENAAEQMNKFVESATHGKIKQLVEPNTLNELTRLVLVNAIYFCDRWSGKFDPVLTKTAKFHISNEKQIEVEMMESDWLDYHDYVENDELQLVGKAYHSESIEAYFLLPKERFALAKVLANLDGTKLLGLIEAADKMRKSIGEDGSMEVEVIVKLPKYKLEISTDIKEILKRLGLENVFNPDAADFSGIAESNEPLFISNALQKAYIVVNEFGTEAAAVSQMAPATGGVIIHEPKVKKQFIADQPFAMFIVERTQKLVLFAGIFAGK